VPFFSVITPSWQQGAFLRNCIQSVLSQGDSDFEHLIFDNCSTDETADVARGFSHVRFRSEKDCGQSDAVNKGLREAKGEIICWLNSDDGYAPGAFAHLRRAFANPSVWAVFGDVLQIGYDGKENTIAHGRFDSRLDLVRWWKGDAKIHQPAVFFRRRALEKTGFLREDLHFAMDYEFWWRMSEHFPFVYLPEVLAIQHRQPDSKTIRTWEKVLEERERIFSPHYGIIDGGAPDRLMREKRRELARIYRDHAYALVDNRPREALQMLLRSWRQHPGELATMRWAGVFRRLLRNGRKRLSSSSGSPTGVDARQRHNDP
jgi:glycosyltransferase involved in cell wall biosynthesis